MLKKKTLVLNNGSFFSTTCMAQRFHYRPTVNRQRRRRVLSKALKWVLFILLQSFVQVVVCRGLKSNKLFLDHRKNGSSSPTAHRHIQAETRGKKLTKATQYFITYSQAEKASLFLVGRLFRLHSVFVLCPISTGFRAPYFFLLFSYSITIRANSLTYDVIYALWNEINFSAKTFSVRSLFGAHEWIK